MANNKPIKKIEVGGVCLAVWDNEIQTQNGVRSMQRVTMERRYKDKDSNWKSSSSFNAADLPRLKLAIEKAYEWLSFKKPDNDGDDENGLS